MFKSEMVHVRLGREGKGVWVCAYVSVNEGLPEVGSLLVFDPFPSKPDLITLCAKAVPSGFVP